MAHTVSGWHLTSAKVTAVPQSQLLQVQHSWHTQIQWKDLHYTWLLGVCWVALRHLHPNLEGCGSEQAGCCARLGEPALSMLHKSSSCCLLDKAPSTHQSAPALLFLMGSLILDTRKRFQSRHVSGFNDCTVCPVNHQQLSCAKL